MSEMMIIWLVIILLSIGIEVATLGLASIWFAGGGLVGLIATALNAPLVVQILLFFVVSLLLLFFTRPIAVKYFNKDRVKTNVESMVGKQGIVIEQINNLHATGQVVVGGQEWTARSIDDDVMIQKGAVVEIMAISGVKLMVKPEEQNMVKQPEAGQTVVTEGKSE